MGAVLNARVSTGHGGGDILYYYIYMSTICVYRPFSSYAFKPYRFCFIEIDLASTNECVQKILSILTIMFLKP